MAIDIDKCRDHFNRYCHYRYAPIDRVGQSTPPTPLLIEKMEKEVDKPTEKRNAGVAAGKAGKVTKKKNTEILALARRRLFLLVNMEVEAAEKDDTINSRIFRSEIIRIVKSDSEMERVLNIMGKIFGTGCLEDRFFRAVRSDLKGFATVVGAFPK